MKLAIALAALALLTMVASAISPGQLQLSDSWLIDSPAGEKRWVEIHRSATDGGIMHISIISRKAGAQPWEITRLVPHLAITAEALCQSVIKPAKEKPAYPEAFEEAYARWQTDREHGQGDICSIPLSEYLAVHKPGATSK